MEEKHENIDAKSAAQISADYLEDISKENIRDIQVEEIELVTDEEEQTHYWLVTLSYTDADNVYFSQEVARKFKEFKILKETGEVLHMKIKRF